MKIEYDTAQVTGQVTAQVARVLEAAKTPKTREELQDAAGIAHREHFRIAYLVPLLSAGWLERTIPDKPRSRMQRYRTTETGREAIAREGG
jgi:ATP-dependent DNA helicase RecG